MASQQVVHAGGFIYMGGVAAPEARGDVAAQTRGVLERARAALADAGSSLDQVVSVLVFLKSASAFPVMNAAYGGFWARDYPTRTTVVTDLPTPGAEVEMSMVAVGAGGERTVVHPHGWAVSPSPYSYAIRTGDTVFLSGLVSRDGRDNTPIGGDVGTQTKVILDSAGELLAAAGLSHAHIVSSRIYLPDVASFAAMNEAYRPYFPAAPPARATVQTALAGPQYSVEVTFIASASPGRHLTTGLPPNLNLPLSAAVVAGPRTYLAGALGNDESNRGDVAAQTRATLAKLQRTLDEAGTSRGEVAEAFVYVTDLRHLPDVDREYAGFFGAHAPARTDIQCGLMAADGLVEIMLTAAATDEHR